jgi:hypothetical protein
MLDDVLLPPAEGVIAKHGLQDGEWVGRHEFVTIAPNN